MVYMVLEPHNVGRRITLDSRIIDVAIDDLRGEMRALMLMTDDQEQFFRYLVGRNSTHPPLPLVQQLKVVYNLQHVFDCCPNADTFDTIRFPMVERVRKVYKLREKAIKQTSKGRRR